MRFTAEITSLIGNPREKQKYGVFYNNKRGNEKAVAAFIAHKMLSH
jgi:hypothetical protein